MSAFDDFRFELEARLELMCQKGCRRVWLDIEALETGQELPETRGLDREQQRWLLAELKQVMAVYSGRCSVD